MTFRYRPFSMCLLFLAMLLPLAQASGEPAPSTTDAAFEVIRNGNIAQINTKDGDVGFLADYFQSPGLKGDPAVTRIVTSVELHGIEKELTVSSIRWRGAVIPKHSSSFRISLRSTSKARVLVDGQVVASLETDDTDFKKRSVGAVELEAQKPYEFVVELPNAKRDAKLVAEWSPTIASGATATHAGAHQPEETVGP